jgi:hypothetical protein
MKTATVRNVALTAPYFHNGGQATLRQVVEFYNRGGDFSNENQDDRDPDIRVLGLTEEEIDALVAFLDKAVTDTRVSYESGFFDHPSINVPNGGTAGVYASLFGCIPGLPSAPECVLDDRVEVPAVGILGNWFLTGGQGLGVPNSPFAHFLDALQ